MAKHMYIKFLDLWYLRQTGYFGKWQKLSCLLQQKNRPHFNTFQRLLHVMQLQNTLAEMFSINISWCMHLRKFKLQNKDSVTFDICIDMYISNIFETFAPPPQKKKTQMQWPFRESNYQNYSGCKLTHMDISAMGRDFTLPKLNDKALHGPSVYIQWTI